MRKIYIAKESSMIPDEIKKELHKENDSYFIEDTKENRLKYESILPLGFSSRKIELNIDLIPQNSWKASLSNSLTKKSWDAIRKPFIASYGNRCQICGRKGTSINKTIQDVDTHEIWEYSRMDSKVKKQTLVGFVAVCSSCHLMFHLGFAEKIGKQQETIVRLQRLEKLSNTEKDARVAEIFKKWSVRSKYDWEIDISMLRNYGFNDLTFKKDVKDENFKY